MEFPNKIKIKSKITIRNMIRSEITIKSKNTLDLALNRLPNRNLYLVHNRCD